MRKIAVVFLAMLLASCSTLHPDKDFFAKKVSYSKLDGWTDDEFTEVLPALKKTCENPKWQWKKFCDGLSDFDDSSSNRQIRRYIEKNLTPYAIYSYGSDKGTFTGYYEASLTGSFEKQNDNQYPIYALPDNLIRLDTRTVCQPGGDTGTVIGRVEGGRMLPYWTRKDITPENVRAPVLVWADDEVDAFILHIQGSGRVETPDGVVHIGYAGNNGHGFVGIGSIMAAEGLLQSGKSSMPHIRKWLKENPDEARDLMNRNPRYIFFKILPQSDGPIGAAGVSLTPQRSIAVDTTYIPLGTPMFLDTKDPDGEVIQKTVVAQDIGSAIKGGIRADYFWGYGEDAFDKAGRMKSVGRYFILWPNGLKPPVER